MFSVIVIVTISIVVIGGLYALGRYSMKAQREDAEKHSSAARESNCCHK